MNKKPLSVKMRCPFSRTDETVYFYPIEHQGQWYVSFNGCDKYWHKCLECDICSEQAYEELTIDE